MGKHQEESVGFKDGLRNFLEKRQNVNKKKDVAQTKAIKQIPKKDKDLIVKSARTVKKKKIKAW